MGDQANWAQVTQAFIIGEYRDRVVEIVNIPLEKMVPLDQAANPRIRTKVLKLDTEFDDALFDIIESLRQGGISVDEYQRNSANLLEEVGLGQKFADEISIAKSQDEQNWLVRRHTDECRYTLLFFKVDENEIHPPHQHHNLISTQVVIEGKIHLREYERVGLDGDNRLQMQLVRDAQLGPGEVFQASEWCRNVHWFGAIEGPALLLNINARGYENTTFAKNDQAPFGRRYIDPGNFDQAGLITCEAIDQAESELRFQGRPLADFPTPIAKGDASANLTIAI